MKTITVKASKSYDVLIGRNLLNKTGSLCSQICPSKTAVIISDTNVWPLYGNTVTDSLQKAGYRVLKYIFTAGEASKNGYTYLNILEFLAENQITRSDILIALGGGVVGDLSGFVAATYTRGIRYIQIPTSLLAMVDSSVGGKTAIDLSAGKNLAGAFYQPSLVICDVDTLLTLPENVFRDGCAEVIKYGVLFDPELFAELKRDGLSFQRESVIARCVDLKRKTVAEDEFDRGTRQLLNLGHTIGHAVEKCSNYTISHGSAVAIGLATVSYCAWKCNLCTANTYQDIQSVLQMFHLPTQIEYTSDQLFSNAQSDKKRSGNQINLIIPERIGKCRIETYTIEQLLEFIKAGR